MSNAECNDEIIVTEKISDDPDNKESTDEKLYKIFSKYTEK